MNDQRGSIWRKWDLHVHTPASFHWSDGKRFAEMTPAEKTAALDRIIEKIISGDISAFGIMDYWTFDGYLALKERVSQRGLALDKAIFPGMELRIEAPVDYRLNIHVLLSDRLTAQQLQDFKATLRIGSIDRPLSDESLVAFARTLDESKAKVHGFEKADLTDENKLLELGSKTAKITRESLKQAQRQIPEDSCFIILPYDTSDGLQRLDWAKHPHDDNYFMQSADIFETRDEANIDLFLGRETPKNKSFIANFLKTMGGRPKPAISGSDAHKIADYGAYPSNRITWIKADTTFEGLRQVTIEPTDRCYIGEIPPKLARVAAHKTKYIDGVTIKKKAESTLRETWFNTSIVLNSGLVAIIGNKGKGKSALTDIIGLLGNTKQSESCSFLSTHGFKHPRDNKAKHFDAKMTWHSGPSQTASLDAAVDENKPELVKYIPQNFLEEICNETAGSRAGNFDQELKKVIFSHVSEEDRLEKASLGDLIAYKSEEANDTIALLKEDLHIINEEIVSLGEKVHPDFKKTLENSLALKQAQLEAHDKAKPEVVNPPQNDPANQSEMVRISTEIEDAKKKRDAFETEMQGAREERNKQTLQIAAIDKLGGKLDNLKRQVETAKVDCDAELKTLGLSFTEIVTFTIDKSALETKKKAAAEAKKKAEDQLDVAYTLGAAFKKAETEKVIANLQVKLDEPNKRYQAYTAALEAWNKGRAQIIGDSVTPSTFQFYKKQLDDLANIPAQLAECEKKRLDKSKEIYAEIRALAEAYRSLYAPVQKFIEDRALAKDEFHLNFEVSIVDGGFSEDFFSKISRGAAGTFYGKDEGEKTLRGFLAEHDFNKEDGVSAFLAELMKSLENDMRTGAPTAVNVQGLLRGETSLIDLYDFLFSLDYMRPRYMLRMGEKELYQLSPGERGTLLLVFYLMIDKSDIPLIIDQPEENLDNHTVFKLLVPCIKEAKERRQIIIVTHNPNLAVVCDAEQIIGAQLDKQNSNEMKYISGAIENPIINRVIVDILEGTRPAFDNRDAKYQAD